MILQIASNILAALPSLTLDEQRPSASTSQRTDVIPLVAGEETAVETTRQERIPEEDIIGTAATQDIFLYLFLINILYACFYVFLHTRCNR